ncbi:MAG: hypothetical protein WDA08_04605 [Weeksellaceae bacterium]|nr:hypothetical protein [Acholeplasmataceae bacterium]
MAVGKKGFQPGNTYGRGRPKGSKNKSSESIRKAFLNFVNDNIDSLQSSFDALEPKERFKVLIEISKFILPTLKSVDYSSTVDNLSDEDFERLLTEIKQEYKLN